jgi:hypothetical protein
MDQTSCTHKATKTDPGDSVKIISGTSHNRPTIVPILMSTESCFFTMSLKPPSFLVGRTATDSAATGIAVSPCPHTSRQSSNLLHPTPASKNDTSPLLPSPPTEITGTCQHNKVVLCSPFAFSLLPSSGPYPPPTPTPAPLPTVPPYRQHRDDNKCRYMPPRPPSFCLSAFY